MGLASGWYLLARVATGGGEVGEGRGGCGGVLELLSRLPVRTACEIHIFC